MFQLKLFTNYVSDSGNLPVYKKADPLLKQCVCAHLWCKADIKNVTLYGGSHKIISIWPER